ncbi:MAG TPA: hypothetical protein GXX35_10140 [Thermoanaerobacterales bacterium]|nr:hypothetical protein [Thermoanaerobacterales bacterium]
MTEEKQGKCKIIYPEEFNSNYIFTYFSFNEELKVLLEESGQKKNFSRKYKIKLSFLEKLKKQCIYQKSFEQLKDNGIIYSIRFVDKQNIRILFSFFYDKGREIVILLNCFQEKENKKKTSSKSYAKAIEVAKERINELMGTGLKLS